MRGTQRKAPACRRGWGVQGWRLTLSDGTPMAKIDRITIRLDRETLDRLEAEADRQRRTLSDLARLTLADHLPPLPEPAQTAETAETAP